MNCKKCGSPLVEGATVCGVCGERVDGQVVNQVSNAPVENSVQAPVMDNTSGVQSPPVGVTPVPPVVNNTGIGNGEPLQPTMENVQQTVPVQPATNLNQPVAPVQLTANVVPPVQPVETINQPVNSNVVAQPNNMAPLGAQPVTNGNAPQPEKKNNMVFLIICGVLVIVIIVLAVLILNNNSGKKTADEPNTTAAANNTSSTTSSTSSTTLPRTQATPTSGNYADYYGIKLYVPETFITQSQNESLVYTSTTKRQMLMVQVIAYDYEDAILEFDDFVKSMEESGLVSTTKSQTEYKGMKYSVVRGTVEGENVSTGYARFASGYTIMFIFRTDYATENEYLETLLQIVANSKSSSSFSKEPSKDTNISSFIKDSPKINIE